MKYSSILFGFLLVIGVALSAHTEPMTQAERREYMLRKYRCQRLCAMEEGGYECNCHLRMFGKRVSSVEMSPNMFGHLQPRRGI